MSGDTLTETFLGEEDENASSSVPKEEESTEKVSLADELKASEERIMKSLTEGLRANRQSQTATIDDRVTGMEGRLAKKYEALLPEGTDVEALKRDAWTESQMDTPEDGKPTDESPQASSDSPAKAESYINQEIAQILKEHGLSGDEPELREYAKANAGKRWSQVGAGFEELAKMLGERNEGDGASFQGSPSGSPPNPNLEAQYRKEVNQLREDGQYGMRHLRPIQEKYQKLGLDTDQVALV